MTGCSSFLPQPGTISVMNSEAQMLSGLAISAASSDVANDPKINGSTPYIGSPLLPSGSQVVPNKKSLRLTPSRKKVASPLDATK